MLITFKPISVSAQKLLIVLVYHEDVIYCLSLSLSLSLTDTSWFTFSEISHSS